MHCFRRLLAVGAVAILLASCATDNEDPAPPAALATPTEAAAQEVDDSEAASQSASDSGPLVVESELHVASLEDLVEHTGVDCAEAEEATTSGTHTARSCQRVLLAVFDDTTPLEGYVNGYLDKGNSVVRGENWFVTGKPDVIDTLTGVLRNA